MDIIQAFTVDFIYFVYIVSIFYPLSAIAYFKGRDLDTDEKLFLLLILKDVNLRDVM